MSIGRHASPARRWPLRACFAALLVGALLASLAPRPSASGSLAPSAGPADPDVSIRQMDAIPTLDTRLSLLSPDKPMAYFLLAEEVAGEASTNAERALARRLYVLAMALDRATGQPGRLAPGACLGLAAIEPRDPTRRWLVATAQLLDTELAFRSPESPRVQRVLIETPWNVALSAAHVLSFARSGESARAEDQLRQPGVRAVLEAYEAALDSATRIAGFARVQASIDEWRGRCPTCKGQRTVMVRPASGNARATPTICDRCQGVAGPRLSPEEYTADLRFESLLLRGVHRSWAAQSLADQGRPLRDPSPDGVAGLYAIDDSKSVFRAGRWAAPVPSAP
jgi:hypothetical protein